MKILSVLAIDPGPFDSGWLVFELGKPRAWGQEPNEKLLVRLRELQPIAYDAVVIERVVSFMVRAGAEVFETALWAGRFLEAAHHVPAHVIGRPKVKTTILGTPAASDADVRAALIDRFGPGKAKAIGLKATPGPLYGITKHCWSALAIAVAFCDLYPAGPPPTTPESKAAYGGARAPR